MTARGPNHADRPRLPASTSNLRLADGRRIASREQDLGLGWRVGLHGPIHRAAWLRDTGELYVVRDGTAKAEGSEVQLLGIVRDHDELEQTLEGWRDICHQPDSMNWLRHRAASLEETTWEVRPHPATKRLRGPVAALRRHVDSKVVVVVGATAGITAPATALLLELAAT